MFFFISDNEINEIEIKYYFEFNSIQIISFTQNTIQTVRRLPVDFQKYVLLGKIILRTPSTSTSHSALIPQRDQIVSQIPDIGHGDLSLRVRLLRGALRYVTLHQSPHDALNGKVTMIMTIKI